MSDTSTSDDSNSSTLDRTASRIAERCELSAAEAKADIEEFLDYGVSFDKALKTLASDYDFSTAEVKVLDIVPVDTIDTTDRGHDIKVKFVTEFEPQSDTVAQSGRIGDESGTISFTTFTSTTGVPTLTEGECYKIEDAYVSSYNDGVELHLNDNTDVVHLPDASIDVPSTGGSEYTGTVVKVKRGSGLITRCDQEDCSRTLSNGQCSEHGPQSGTHDLRVKATLDDGSDPNPPTAVFDADMVAELTGMTLEDAIELSANNVGSSVVTDRLREQLIAQRLTIVGGVYENDRSDTIVVNEATNDSGLNADTVDDALVSARQLMSSD